MRLRARRNRGHGPDNESANIAYCRVPLSWTHGAIGPVGISEVTAKAHPAYIEQVLEASMDQVAGATKQELIYKYGAQVVSEIEE